MPVPVTTNFVAAPDPILTLPDVEAVPVAGVKVKVPVPDVPVNVMAEVKLAIPLTKSPAAFNTFVPDKPVIAPVNVVVTVTLFALASKLVTVLP